ncbi:MAG: hypothetical protein MUE52_09750 [Tabrizicola sp.]|nr:hypothetical protein [Tabrizicola sp.]
MALLVAATAQADSTGPERLGQFAGSVMGAFTQEGKFDPAGFGCAEIVAGDPGLQECIDPVSALGFLYLPSEEGDDLSLTVTARTATAKPTDLQVADRTEAMALHAGFVALSDMPPFAGAPRCATGGSQAPEMDIPSASFALVHPVGGQRVALVFGGLDAGAIADLADPDGAPILSAILVASRIRMPCDPLE